MTIIYRKLTAADAPTYRAIRLESLRLHPQNFGASYEQQKVLPKLHMEAVLEEGENGRFVMGAFEHDQLIGICAFVPFAPEDKPRQGDGMIIQVYVKAAYSGQKVGLGMMQAIIQAAFQQPNINEIVLSVKLGNVAAIRVYEQAGFTVYGIDEDEQLMAMRREYAQSLHHVRSDTIVTKGMVCCMDKEAPHRISCWQIGDVGRSV